MIELGAAVSDGYGDEPATLIFADDAMTRRAAGEAVAALGGRVSAVLPLSEAAGRLFAQLTLDTVLIDLDRDGGEEQDRLLDALNVLACEGRVTGVIAMPLDILDAVTARIDHPAIALLCDPTTMEWTAAIGFAFAERRCRLNDISVDAEADRFRQLSEEVGRIARALARLSGADSEPAVRTESRARDVMIGFRAEPVVAEMHRATVDARGVRTEIRRRRLREQFFPADLFADPAWDMLLDLMAARLEGRQVAVSSLCIAAAVPATTALRWIRTMSDQGLFTRRADPEDGRRVFIELSEDAVEGMAGYFQTLNRCD